MSATDFVFLAWMKLKNIFRSLLLFTYGLKPFCVNLQLNDVNDMYGGGFGTISIKYTVYMPFDRTLITFDRIYMAFDHTIMAFDRIYTAFDHTIIAFDRIYRTFEHFHMTFERTWWQSILPTWHLMKRHDIRSNTRFIESCSMALDRGQWKHYWKKFWREIVIQKVLLKSFRRVRVQSVFKEMSEERERSVGRVVEILRQAIHQIEDNVSNTSAPSASRGSSAPDTRAPNNMIDPYEFRY